MIKRYNNMVIVKWIGCVLMIHALLLVSIWAGAQQPAAPTDTLSAMDSLRNGFVESMKKLGDRQSKRSQEKFRNDRAEIRQSQIVDNIRQNINASKVYLRDGIDTAGINSDIERIENWYDIATDGILTNTGTAQTHRNLNNSSKLITELLVRARLRKNQLDMVRRRLMDFRNNIDSLSTDSALYEIPADSVGLTRYISKLEQVEREVKPADSVLTHALPVVQKLDLRLSQLVSRMESGLDEIDALEKQLSAKAFGQEFPFLWQKPASARPFSEIVHFSRAKGRLALHFYAANNAGKLFLLLLILASCTIFIHSLKKKVKEQQLLRDDFSGQLVLRYPFGSALLIVLNLFQFIFPAPPFIFNCLFWIIAAICLTIIMRGFVARYWMSVWLITFFLFLLACGDNLVLQASRPERWGMFFLSLAALVFGLYVLIRGRKRELKEKAILYFIAFVVLIEIASLIANLLGRYNFSKSLLASGLLSMTTAMLFLWTVRLINEGLVLASEVYRRPESQLFFINFERVGKRVPAIFYVLLVFGWLVLFGRNFYEFNLVTQPIRDFLAADRYIGSYSFSIQSIFIFFLVLVLAVIISRIVSFFASEKHAYHSPSDDSGRYGLGSWLLLIRIAIISVGLFLAFAAAGIALDRIALIIGALGIGIGFGLNTLVNNLVSGLIIAFEKPVNVGDIVEFDGKSGTIKSIGFRSSILGTFDGADIVIPNGNLLNEQVVNWTQGNTLRRGEVVVGVAYGSDLKKASDILNQLLQANQKILKSPPPVVLARDFSPSSIDFRAVFWMGHPRDWLPIKSELIQAIHAAFKEQGIRIPFPQQDLHLRSYIHEEEKGREPGLPPAH